MTSEELSKFVNQQHLRGMSDEAIAGSLGLTPEAMYRKMGEGDNEGVKVTKEIARSLGLTPEAIGLTSGDNEEVKVTKE